MADSSVRADTPDPTRYHVNRSGMPGTMIPRAGADGQSLGFDPNRPQAVIVDPGVEGGGFVLDLKALVASNPNFNAEAKRGGVVDDVHSFYKELSQQAVTEKNIDFTEKEQFMAESVEPVNSKMEEAIKTLLDEELPKAENTKKQIKKHRLAAEATIAAISAEDAQKWAQQDQLLNALVSRVNRLSAASPEQKEIPNSTQNAFAKLQIPFISGIKPERPQYEVYFEMAKLGTMSARYHAVVAGDACVALIYDTRFEDGFQYLPPNLRDEQIIISVPKTKETYTCSSLGLHWSLGCLDVVILIRYKED